MKRLLYLLIFLAIVVGGLGLFAFLKPDLAKSLLADTQTFLTSPKVKGFFWPKVTEGQFTIVYQEENIPNDYVQAIMKIVEVSSNVVEEELGRSYIRPVTIYVFVDEEGRSYFWNNGEDEVRLVFSDTNEMLPPGVGGTQNHVSQIANHLAQLVGQVQSSGTDTPTPNNLATSSLATYIEMNLILPQLWAQEKEHLWPSPYNYVRNMGPEAYAALASNPPLDMAAGRLWSKWDTFWYRLDREGGPEAVGTVLNQAAGPVGNADVARLARAVENVTENEELVKLLEEADKSSAF